jgi:TetR/AcrR family transcriptional regulator, lmrAB and yxaGH operons repressor
VPSDSRDRMVRAAVDLFRERGYAATSLGDVLARSGAPRGSIYHHFPGGKAELAAEALRRYSAASVRFLTRAVEGGSAADVVRAFVGYAADGLARSGFQQGCPVAGVALDLTQEDGALAAVVTEAFAAWRAVLRAALERDGATPAQARRLAALVVASVEGALLLARAERSTAPLDDVKVELVSHVRAALATTGR